MPLKLLKIPLNMIEWAERHREHDGCNKNWPIRLQYAPNTYNPEKDLTYTPNIRIAMAYTHKEYLQYVHYKAIIRMEVKTKGP